MAAQMEVYRLLRADENTVNGLSAKAPNQQSSVVYHVAYGSKPANQSRFISACGSLEIAIGFRTTNQQNGFPNGPIVKIIIDNTMNVHDLRTYDQRQHILEAENVIYPQEDETIDRFHNFAGTFQEVIIVDQVPAGNIVVLDV